MVVLNKIYTRTGDSGTTALGSGERVGKASARISAYGTVDETNSAIGMARMHLTTAGSTAPVPEAPVPEGDDRKAEPRADDLANTLDLNLARIQNDLFDLGADLCVPDKGEKLDYEPLRITLPQVKWLEDEIDAMNLEMTPLRSFVLPAGTPAAAALHLARTICRRAERLMVELAALPDEAVSAAALQYVNRLSDYLFVASRYANDKGKADVLWVAGKNR